MAECSDTELIQNRDNFGLLLLQNLQQTLQQLKDPCPQTEKPPFTTRFEHFSLSPGTRQRDETASDLPAVTTLTVLCTDAKFGFSKAPYPGLVTVQIGTEVACLLPEEDAATAKQFLAVPGESTQHAIDPLCFKPSLEAMNATKHLQERLLMDIVKTAKLEANSARHKSSTPSLIMAETTVASDSRFPKAGERRHQFVPAENFNLAFSDKERFLRDGHVGSSMVSTKLAFQLEDIDAVLGAVEKAIQKKTARIPSIVNEQAPYQLMPQTPNLG